jgi:branched-chain amino acid aminotransferase
LDKNNHNAIARVRLTIFRGDEGLYEDIAVSPNFLIQSWVGNEESNKLNDCGWTLGFFHDAKKSSDNFSGIKSNNYLPSVMGAFYAKRNNLNDCLIYNCTGGIAEASIANVFILNNGVIKTPAITEGCVNGVMRRYLINSMRRNDLPINECQLLQEDISQASEVFLTNALYGIRWVSTIGSSNYTNSMAAFLHKKFVAPLFSV